MEENLHKMSKNLASFCNKLTSSTQAFKQSLDRRPIPLDSASTTFMQSLNGRVCSLTSELNLLESMSFGTVSFEELLGHCNQLYQLNHSQLLHLHHTLQSSGYISSTDGVDDLDEDVMAQSNDSPESESHKLSFYHGSAIDDPLIEEPPSLQNLGLSDYCLATLAAEGNNDTELDTPPKFRSSQVQQQHVTHSENAVTAEVTSKDSLCQASKPITVSDDDYASLPSYMKTLSPWKDLQSAIEKMNSFLSKRGTLAEGSFFHPQDLESMGLGPKGRTYLLLLVRLNRLVVETNNGLISYRVL